MFLVKTDSLLQLLLFNKMNVPLNCHGVYDQRLFLANCFCVNCIELFINLILFIVCHLSFVAVWTLGLF